MQLAKPRWLSGSDPTVSLPWLTVREWESSSRFYEIVPRGYKAIRMVYWLAIAKYLWFIRCPCFVCKVTYPIGSFIFTSAARYLVASNDGTNYCVRRIISSLPSIIFYVTTNFYYISTSSKLNITAAMVFHRPTECWSAAHIVLECLWHAGEMKWAINIHKYTCGNVLMLHIVIENVHMCLGSVYKSRWKRNIQCR